MKRGALYIVSAPSGTGKTTVVKRLVERVPGLVVSRSYTSRPRRPDETDGIHYHFVTRETFDRMVAEDALLEWAELYGNLYGTARADTERLLASGRDVVLVIDVEGARQVREHRLGAVSVFLLPPSADDLERRLRSRSKDSEESIRRRLDVARREVATCREYNYVVVNDDLDRCVGVLASIVVAERARGTAMDPAISTIVRSFATSSERV